MLNNQAQRYIRGIKTNDEQENAIAEDQVNEEAASEQDNDEKNEESASEQDNDEKNEEAASEQDNDEDSSDSVLLTAVQHSNKEIIDYLISYWSDLIQDLPVNHQIRASTAAYDLNQLDVLCDLLEISDFPFPDGFSLDHQHQLNHERLQTIVTSRIKFHEGIKAENYDEINEFINNNLSIKFIYSPKNITAMKHAIDFRNYKVYYYLKSFGFCAVEFEDLKKILNKEEFEEAQTQENLQIKEVTAEAIRNPNKAVSILSLKSLIHNRKVKKDDEIKYRQHIKRLLGDIYKVAEPMLDVAASCEDLVIVFDFESNFVNRTAFRDYSLGLSYSTISSRIFIGAKLGDHNRDQEIKGVLAHELCHYVMSMVYSNRFLPYYEHATGVRDKFDEIVKSIDKWSADDEEQLDDECDGIISTVFAYNERCFHSELIVRVVHLSAQYDDNLEHLAYLQGKYQILFDFWFTKVVPELQKYLQKNKVVIRVNTSVELLSSLSKSLIKSSASKNIDQLITNQITIVTTNVPKLLLMNIFKHLQEKSGCLLDSQNIFLKQEQIRNKQVMIDFNYLRNREVKLSVFVDCTKEHEASSMDELGSILSNFNLRIVLVSSNTEQSDKLTELCSNNRKIKPIFVDIKYSWSDLTEESQTELLETKVKFQNNSEITLKELLADNTNLDENEAKNDSNDFLSSINNKFFNLLVEQQQQISINSDEAEDDSNVKNFEFLYQNRKFLRKSVNFKYEISQENLIKNNSNNKFVLISDIAGSGKSWVIKNISNLIRRQFPTRWVTYVDLKQFIKEFKEQKLKPDFTSFFIEMILKPKTEFEVEIFKKHYKNGKVSIIFDGFDEIAPDCAEFVADLAESFEHNAGNQLWIVTRDYFEVNLQQKLKIDNIYKLTEFTDEDGVKFIVASWILTDLKNPTIEEFKNCLQNSPNLSKYQEKAEKIVKKMKMSKNQSIGLPQLFSMTAEGYKDDKYKIDDLKRAKIFLKLVNKKIKIWTYHKGGIRKKGSKKSQHYKLTFIAFHHFCAISSSFPEYIKIFFPDYEPSEWPVTEIIAGGVVIKIGSTYSFIHETFCEFFIADFIFKNLINPKTVKLLIQVLTIQKYGIIRMFLNDFIDSSMLDRVQLELVKSVKKFEDMENLSEYFTENQEQLAQLVIAILKIGNYEKVKKILNDNIKAVATKAKDLIMFRLFVDFLFSILTDEDLKDMINQQNILQFMIGSDLDVEIFEFFVSKLEGQVGPDFIQQELKLMPTEPEAGNIFYHLGTSESLGQEKVQRFFEIILKYLNKDEIIELMDKSTSNGHSILKILTEYTTNFKPFLDGAEALLKDENVLHKFKNIVCKTDSDGQHSLHWSASKESIEFHASVWKLLLDIFKSIEELGAFALQNDKLGNNFLQILVVFNNPESVNFTIKKLKDIFSRSDYQKILRSKGNSGRNLLQRAAVNSKEVKTHRILWKELRDSCKSDDEFLEILKEVDEEGNNVFHLAAAFTTSEEFEFMISELEKLKNDKETKKVLKSFGLANKNLLQSAAIDNKSLETNQEIWTIICKYFDAEERLEFIDHKMNSGNNLLCCAVNCNTKEIVEFTWNQIKSLKVTKELQIEYLNRKGWQGKNLHQLALENQSNDSEVAAWVQEIMKDYKIVFTK